MTRQNLNEREIAIALAEMTDRFTIRQARDYLKARGLLPYDDEDRDLWELDQVRKAIQRLRNRGYRNQEETNVLEFVNLFEVLEGGAKQEYYRKAEDCSIEEAVQHLEYWNKSRTTAERRILHYFKVFAKVHGKRKIQQRLSFALPAPVG